ncbi:conserved hypothetical protein [Ricinus communis]|uniref:Uncharacterized protein n=1 Tax=Ricinus communis TaxID=3988 RepID=B9SRD4_RICCO|nr:conserved hypothetical protein [Ricinus communis]
MPILEGFVAIRGDKKTTEYTLAVTGSQESLPIEEIIIGERKQAKTKPINDC